MNEIRNNGSNESYLRFCTTSATTTTGIFLLGFPHTHAHTHIHCWPLFDIADADVPTAATAAAVFHSHTEALLSLLRWGRNLGKCFPRCTATHR